MGGIALLIGRIVFSFFFIYSGFNHLTKLSQYAQYAGASGVPAPTLLTALSGVMLLAGGLSILLGIKPRVGALLIAAFLIPAAFTVPTAWAATASPTPSFSAPAPATPWPNTPVAARLRVSRPAKSASCANDGSGRWSGRAARTRSPFAPGWNG